MNPGERLPRTGWAATSSTTYGNDVTGHGPINALDGIVGIVLDTFASKFLTHSWFQLEFPSEVSGIIAVEIIKRGNYLSRFHFVEARIGNSAWSAPSTSGLINVNILCGRYNETDLAQGTAWIICSQELSGQYLTVQQFQGGILEFEEIYALGENSQNICLFV